jgi:hypothetical protein
MRVFRKIFTDDPLQQRLQDSIAQSFSQFEKLPQLDSVIVKDITLSAAVDNNVEHKLGREIVGWQVIRQNANAVVYESSTINTTPSSFVILRTSATCKVSILFF